MNVSLTEELVRFVDDKVKSGLYNNASEVVRESLRLLKIERRDSRMREQIEGGVLHAQAGRLVDGPKAMSETRQGPKEHGPKAFVSHQFSDSRTGRF